MFFTLVFRKNNFLLTVFNSGFELVKSRLKHDFCLQIIALGKILGKIFKYVRAKYYINYKNKMQAQKCILFFI